MPALRIVTTTPAKNAYNVSTQPTIVVRFSADLDPTTVDHNLFYLTRTTDKVIVSIDENSLITSGSEVSFSPVHDAQEDGLYPQTAYTLTISQGIKDILGNELRLPVLISFTTGDAAVGIPSVPIISQPIQGEYIAHDLFKIDWLEATNATGYDIEVSSERSFFSPIKKISVGNVLTTDIISDVFTAGQYFIRVRSKNSSGASQWSEIRSCTYELFSDELGNQPTIVNLWHTPTGFSVESMLPPTETVNKAVASVVFTFTDDLVGTTDDIPDALTVYPEITFEPLYGDTIATINNNHWSVDSNNLKVLTYAPTGGLEDNTTYTFSFPENFKNSLGASLIGETEFWLTTKFSVMYSTVRQVKLRLGTLADSFTDEQIAYQIFLTSIEVNQSLSSGTELAIADAIQPATTTTMAMTKATTSGTMVALIDERLKEIAADGSIKKSLGDLAISSTYDTLKTLQTIRDEAVLEYLATLSAINSVRSETLTQMSNASTLQPIQRSNI